MEGGVVNHYPHHIGDYLKDTAHLTLLEHGCYRRMLDVYYTRELPLPADVAAICRLVGAHSEDERAAVDLIAREFFELLPDGWRQTRCDVEILAQKKKSKANSDFWNAIPRHVRTAIEAERRAAKIRGTPGWLSADQKKEIAEIYGLAKRLSESTGIAYEVDHIVPLRGKDVSGLHVPWNLRAIPASVNRAKGRSH